MIGYFLIGAGVFLAAAGIKLEGDKRRGGWDGFRLNNLESGKLPYLLEEKVKDLARVEAAAEIRIAAGREVRVERPPGAAEVVAKDPKSA